MKQSGTMVVAEMGLWAAMVMLFLVILIQDGQSEKTQKQLYISSTNNWSCPPNSGLSITIPDSRAIRQSDDPNKTPTATTYRRQTYTPREDDPNKTPTQATYRGRQLSPRNSKHQLQEMDKPDRSPTQTRYRSRSRSPKNAPRQLGASDDPENTPTRTTYRGHPCSPKPQALRRLDVDDDPNKTPTQTSYHGRTYGSPTTPTQKSYKQKKMMIQPRQS